MGVESARKQAEKNNRSQFVSLYAIPHLKIYVIEYETRVHVYPVVFFYFIFVLLDAIHLAWLIAQIRPDSRPLSS